MKDFGMETPDGPGGVTAAKWQKRGPWMPFALTSAMSVLYVVGFRHVLLGDGHLSATMSESISAIGWRGMAAGTLVQPLSVLLRTCVLALLLQLFSMLTDNLVKFRDGFVAAQYGALVSTSQLLLLLALAWYSGSLDYLQHPIGSLAALLPVQGLALVWRIAAAQINLFELLWCMLVFAVLRGRTRIGARAALWVTGGTWAITFLTHVIIGLTPALLGLPTPVQP